jgi:MSHA biogenesis protein MshJ
MIRRYWGLASSKVDDLSLRERAMIFAAAAFVVISLINAMLLDPLLAKQKALSAQVVQHQEKMKEAQAQMQALLQAKRDDEHSPARLRLAQLKQQLQEQDAYLQSRQERLVEPGKMASLLEQVLNKNGKLELVALNTLPVGLLIEKPSTDGVAAQPAATALPEGEKQIFKHGVKITVRGSYLDLLQYLTALEKMPVQMFWGEASLSVGQYPVATLTLTLYTLSLDKTWLAV